MRVRRAKTTAELGLTRPRVFRQWKLGKEPPQFGDLSVTEAQIYLATGSDIEALFLHEEHGNHPGFWARTDPVYDPHRLVAHADALNRPYIGMQIAIPAQWVEAPVRYSKQTAQTLAKLGRTSRAGYRAAKEQIRNRREQQNPAVPNPAMASEAAENGASWGGLSGSTTWTPGNGIPAFDASVPDIPVARYPRQVVTFTTPGQTTVQRADVFDTAAGADDPEDVDDNEAPAGQWAMQYRRVVTNDRLLHIGPVTGGPDIPLVCDSKAFWYIAYTPGDLIGLQTAFSHKLCVACEAWLAEQPPIEVEQVILGRPSVLSVSLRPDSEPVTAQAGEDLPLPALSAEQVLEQMPTFLLTEPKAYLPTILQKTGLISSRDRARAAINDGSVTIEGWPPIAHRHTFKSKDLNGKTLTIGGIPALRFTTQVTADSPERTDS